jgi:actin-like ATPase involved in cell morphogenesis
VLTVPDETGRKSSYTLDLGTAKTAVIHTLKIGGDVMDSKQVSTVNGKITLEITETPVFVEGVN